MRLTRSGVLRPLGRRSLTFPLVCAIAAFAVCWAVLSSADRPGHAVVQLDLTFSKSACCSMAIWLNGQSSGPTAVETIVPGSRHTYTVAVDAPRIDRLRVDFGSVPGSTMVVHAVAVTSGGRQLDVLPLSEVASFAVYRAVQVPVKDGVEFRASESTPSIDQFIHLTTHRGALRADLVKLTGKPLDTFVLVILIGVVLVAILSIGSRLHAGLVVALALAGVLILQLPSLTRRLHPSSDVTQAVGRTGYFGVPKSRDLAELVLTAVIALLVPLLLAFGSSRRLRSSGTLEPYAQTGLRSNHPTLRQWLLPGVSVGFIALFFAPDLRAQLAAARSISYSADWDQTNLTFWQFLVTKGLVPMKDFFYPYGFQYLFTQSELWGPLISYASFLAFWVYVIVGFFLFLSRVVPSRTLVVRFAVVAGILITAVVGGVAPLESRYIGALGLVLVFASIEPEAMMLAPRRLLFVVAALHLTLFEPAQVGYATPAIALIALVDLAEIRTRGRRIVAKAAARAIAIWGAPVALAAGIFALNGQLHGLTTFYVTQLRAGAAAWGSISTLDQWVRHPANLAGFVYWGATASLALGVWGMVVYRGEKRLAHAAVAACGILSFAMLQKQVLRQGIESAIWLPAVAGLLLWAVVELGPGMVRRWCATTAIVGVLLALGVADGSFRTGLRTLADGPRSVDRTIRALVGDRGAFANAAKGRFAPSRFAARATYQPVVTALRGDSVFHTGRLWVMGDDKTIEMMLNRPSPYYFNTFWEASPVNLQSEFVGELEKRLPAVAVWNPQESSFDGVPNVVRVPLIYQWAIAHLVPVRTVSPFEILHLRKSDETIPLAWWRARLGDVVEEGDVPGETHLPKRLCRPSDVPASCRTFVDVEFRRTAPPSFDVKMRVDGLRFGAAATTLPGTRTYVFDLERLWFWGAMPSAAEKVVLTRQLSGAKVRIVRRQVSPSDLY